jgi:hypothetical protein
MVIKCKISPEYFLNDMSEKETAALLNTYSQVYKEEAEERRWLAYVIAQSLTGGYKDIKDLRKFSWEIEKKEEINEQELKERLEFLESLINK